MPRTKITPRKRAPGHANINVLPALAAQGAMHHDGTAPAAQGAMHHGGTAPVAQQGVGVTGAAPPHVLHRVSKKKKRHHIITEASHDDEQGKFLDWKDFPASLDESTGSKYEVVFTRKVKCTVMISDWSDDDNDPEIPTKSGDELRAMAVQLRTDIKRKFLRGEYYTNTDEE